MMYLAADHGGAALKNRLLPWLQERYGAVVVDVTPKTAPRDDYPKQAVALVRRMKHDPHAFGIAICRSGVGMAMTVNRFRDFRAVHADRPLIAKKARTDEDANVIALGGEVVTLAAAKRILTTFLETEYRPVVRYDRRIKELRRYGNA